MVEIVVRPLDDVLADTDGAPAPVDRGALQLRGIEREQPAQVGGPPSPPESEAGERRTWLRRQLPGRHRAAIRPGRHGLETRPEQPVDVQEVGHDLAR